mmetsp:Transcript_71194/g.169973  ORF Transcript_71194/g.169973 Transcript_71194/m.169973 type:complete len:276 (+) Transcript_71194:52-879(+)
MRLAVVLLLTALALGQARNPFLALADDIDIMSEEKKRPDTVEGWVYVMLTPWIGLTMFVISFPILWWNERRATGQRAAHPSSAAAGGSTVPVVQGTPVNKDGPDNARGADVEAEAVVGKEVATTERHSLLQLSPTEAYQEGVNNFEDRICTPFYCRAVRQCFEKMPELDGYGDCRTYFFRVLGVMMMFTGIDMFLSPTYFLVHSLWFFGFIVAGHLALCACKSACLLSIGTMATSYIIHRPGIVLFLATSIVGVSALSLYYNVPTHGAAAAAAHR